MEFPLLIAKPALAFMVDMAMVVSYAQCVAEGFVLLITTVHRFRYILVYVYKDDHTLSRSRSVLDIVRNHVVTAVIFAHCLRSNRGSLCILGQHIIWTSTYFEANVVNG